MEIVKIKASDLYEKIYIHVIWLKASEVNYESFWLLFEYLVKLSNGSPFIRNQRTCNGLAVFWPTMDLAEIWIYGGLSFVLSHEHVFELTTAYAVT